MKIKAKPQVIETYDLGPLGSGWKIESVWERFFLKLVRENQYLIAHRDLASTLFEQEAEFTILSGSEKILSKLADLE